jgi:hypothetical protein
MPRHSVNKPLILNGLYRMIALGRTPLVHMLFHRTKKVQPDAMSGFPAPTI